MGLLILKADHLPVLASLVGFAGTCQINRLQDIGLSLGIVAVENIGALIKIHLQRLIIPEIIQSDGFNVHSFTRSHKYLFHRRKWYLQDGSCGHGGSPPHRSPVPDHH